MILQPCISGGGAKVQTGTFSVAEDVINQDYYNLTHTFGEKPDIVIIGTDSDSLEANDFVGLCACKTEYFGTDGNLLYSVAYSYATASASSTVTTTSAYSNGYRDGTTASNIRIPIVKKRIPTGVTYKYTFIKL